MSKKGSKGIYTRYKNHHCPTCGKANKRVCVKKGHYIVCEKHAEKYGSWYYCVKCREEEERNCHKDDGSDKASKPRKRSDGMSRDRESANRDPKTARRDNRS